jgi:[ribosomal protein S18]-alanine N-acetyltransferase
LSETTTAESATIEPAEVAFRRIGYGDLPAVLSIERRSFPAPWSLAMFVLEVSKPSGVCIAAVAGDEIIGYLVCSRYADVFHLMNVAVDPDLRRLGIAARMVERMLDEAGRDERYTLEVRISNHAAIAMYEKLGFRRAGRRRRYYSDNGEDAMIMWLGEPGF